MKEFLRKNTRLLFYSLFLLLGLMQASFTELLDDEAYYWVYSRFPGLGYFDHPPLLAIIIKMGYAIFPNELGVRLFPLLLNLLLLFILEKLVGKKKPSLFYAIALSMAVFQLMGFLAVPDIPLMCFTALFLYCYKKLLEKPSLFNTVMLGLVGALLLYSKYHAVLIFLFLLISNPGLLKRYQFYLALGLSFLLFLPHLWWQYQHDWVSFRYHLFESNVNDYKLSHTLEYIAGQLLLPGPIVGIILLPAAFLYKYKDPFEKGLSFIMIGVYLFFLLSSFRGKVELNWTSPALIPLFILSYKYLDEKNNWRKILFRLLPASLILIVFLRIIMIVDIIPIKTIHAKFHSWDNWPGIMREKTGNSKVVFSNSYQRASKYWFYTGIPTYSLNLYKERRNNFNFWPVEDSFLGNPVFFLDIYDINKYPDSTKTEIGWVGYGYDSSFASFAKVKIIVPKRKYRIKPGEVMELKCRFGIPLFYKNFIANHPDLNDRTVIGFFDKKGWVKDEPISLRLSEMVGEKTIVIRPTLSPGKYYFLFAIHVGNYIGTHNSEKIDLIID